MRVFVCEYLSGGAIASPSGRYRSYGDALYREGNRMAIHLARDLAQGRCHVFLARDRQLLKAAPKPSDIGRRVTYCFARKGESFKAFCRRLIRHCDACWPIAPESYPWLRWISDRTIKNRRHLLSSRAHVFASTASKTACADILDQKGLSSPPSYRIDHFLDHGDRDRDAPGWTVKCDHGDRSRDAPGWTVKCDHADRDAPGWTVKCDHGAGCDKMSWHRCLDDALVGARTRHHENPIIQPWKNGDHCSLNIICADGRASLLSCNKQHLSIHGDHGVSLTAITPGAYNRHWPRLQAVAEKIADALPGLWGLVGIDLVLGHDRDWIIDINPRLTSSCCGLNAAYRINPTTLVLDLVRHRLPRPKRPVLRQRMTISLP